jgi:hypothetical protein
MSASVYSLFVLSCVDSGHMTGSSPVQGALPPRFKIKETEVNGVAGTSYAPEEATSITA